MARHGTACEPLLDNLPSNVRNRSVKASIPLYLQHESVTATAVSHISVLFQSQMELGSIAHFVSVWMAPAVYIDDAQGLDDGACATQKQQPVWVGNIMMSAQVH